MRRHFSARSRYCRNGTDGSSMTLTRRVRMTNPARAFVVPRWLRTFPVAGLVRWILAVLCRCNEIPVGSPTPPRIEPRRRRHKSNPKEYEHSPQNYSEDEVIGMLLKAHVSAVRLWASQNNSQKHRTIELIDGEAGQYQHCEAPEGFSGIGLCQWRESLPHSSDHGEAYHGSCG
jgi:hypothetical protein